MFLLSIYSVITGVSSFSLPLTGDSVCSWSRITCKPCKKNARRNSQSPATSTTPLLRLLTTTTFPLPQQTASTANRSDEKDGRRGGRHRAAAPSTPPGSPDTCRTKNLSGPSNGILDSGDSDDEGPSDLQFT